VEVVDKWDFYLQHNVKRCAAAIILTNHELFIFVFLPFFSLSVPIRSTEGRKVVKAILYY
jgi:hypothetical protein